MASEKEKTTKTRQDSSRNQKDQTEKRSEKGGGKEKQARSENKNASRSEGKLEAGKSAKTTDHDTIRQWVEERGGKPATVRNTTGKNDAGLLRIDFPGRSNRGGKDENTLEEISWDDFFEKFEEKKLAFLYQEKTKTGRESRFSKFVSRD